MRMEVPTWVSAMGRNLLHKAPVLRLDAMAPYLHPRMCASAMPGPLSKVADTLVSKTRGSPFSGGQPKARDVRKRPIRRGEVKPNPQDSRWALR